MSTGKTALIVIGGIAVLWSNGGLYDPATMTAIGLGVVFLVLLIGSTAGGQR